MTSMQPPSRDETGESSEPSGSDATHSSKSAYSIPSQDPKIRTDLQPRRNLLAEALQAAPGQFAHHRYGAGEHIDRQNTRRLIFVTAGWARLFTDTLDGGRVVQAFMSAGEILVPEMWTASGLARIVAVDELLTREIAPAAVASGQARSDLESLVDALRRRQVAILMQHNILLGSMPARPRVAHLLLELSERRAGYGHEPSDDFACPLSQADMAQALGLTAIHFNRIAKSLREERLALVKRGHIRILDRRRMKSLSGFDAGYLAYPGLDRNTLRGIFAHGNS